MLNPMPLEPGKRIGVSFDLAKAHLFATDGGRSISAKGLTTSRLKIEHGLALAPAAPGIGVEWDFDAVNAKSLP